MSSYKRKWLTKRDIYRKPGELYLTRYVLIHTKLLAIYVHKFWMSDHNVPHDHPGNFFSLPLATGYTEHLPDGTALWRGPLSPKFRTAEEFHWVELNKGPAWTLFIRFRSRRNWGFMTPDGWVDHDEYNKTLEMEE